MNLPFDIWPYNWTCTCSSFRRWPFSVRGHEANQMLIDLNPEHTCVIARLVADSYPLAKIITVCSLFDFLNRITY